MPRMCEICSHVNRLDIDRAILSGVSKAEISRAHGVSYASLLNHRAHVSRQMLKSVEIRELSQSRTLATELHELVTRTKKILTDAENRDQPHLSLKAIGELRTILLGMAGLALQLKEDERQDRAADQRTEIDQLKSLPRMELEILNELIQKSRNDGQGRSIVDVRWSDELSPYRMPQIPVEPEPLEPDPPAQIRPPKRRPLSI